VYLSDLDDVVHDRLPFARRLLVDNLRYEPLHCLQAQSEELALAARLSRARAPAAGTTNLIEVRDQGHHIRCSLDLVGFHPRLLNEFLSGSDHGAVSKRLKTGGQESAGGVRSA
jgi:hypothetical protein